MPPSLPAPRDLLPYDGRAVLHERVFAPGQYDLLVQGLTWQQETIRMFGKAHPVPRLTAYYGEHGYTYSGVFHPPAAFPELLDGMRLRVERISGFSFNSVLCNYYRDGQDRMGYHRDNEPEMDTRCIASASFGAARRFKFRHRTRRTVIDVDLSDGSLLIMLDCQDAWEHAVTRTKKPVGGRVNLTFRTICNRGRSST